MVQKLLVRLKLSLYRRHCRCRHMFALHSNLFILFVFIFLQSTVVQLKNFKKFFKLYIVLNKITTYQNHKKHLNSENLT